MPKIIKKTTVKKAETKKKVSPPKAKKTPLKKKTKTVKSIKPTKAKQVVVDVISDDEEFLKDLDAKDNMPAFSSWPTFQKESFEESDGADEDEEEGEEEIVDEEYDKQKKFFSDWAKQIAPQEGETAARVAPQGKSLRLYRRMAFKFILATAVLLGFVFYFFFPKLNITITPQSEAINDSFSFVVSSATTTAATNEGEAEAEKKVKGQIKEIIVSAEKNYQVIGQEIEGEQIVKGQVTIINRYNKSQPLVAKTRLLSPDGKLFRIQDSVNVPAGGEVTVNIYADKPGADMALSASTHFTIPGLWAGLQDKIYAENKNNFSYESQVNYAVSQKDIDLAKKDIDELLNLKAKNEIDSNGGDDIVLYNEVADSFNYSTDVKVGDEKSQFTVKASKKIAVINFSKEIISDMAEARLSLLVPDDKQLSGFDGKQVTYSLEDYDSSSSLATVKAYFGASMFLKSDSSLLDKKKMVGLNRKQISKYLDSFPEIKSYNLNFSPSFISNAPSLPDKISINVKKAD